MLTRYADRHSSALQASGLRLAFPVLAAAAPLPAERAVALTFLNVGRQLKFSVRIPLGAPLGGLAIDVAMQQSTGQGTARSTSSCADHALVCSEAGWHDLNISLPISTMTQSRP